MSKTWFTSDSHFGHRKVIKFCNRPFTGANCCVGIDPEISKNCKQCYGYGKVLEVEEMDEQLIKNWNEIVSPKDDVYHLGDVMFTSKKPDVTNLFKRLNGQIHWIYGNHDKSFRNAAGAAWSGDYKELKVEGQKLILCHYPMMSWNGQMRGTIMLHGHCHGNLKHDGTKLLIDVGVDCWDYKPVSFEEIMIEAEMIKQNNQEKFKQDIVTDDHH